MLLLVFSLMLIVAALMLARSFLKSFDAQTDGNVLEASLLKEQMRALEQEAAQGIVSQNEKESLQLEIERRALKIAKQKRGLEMSGSRDAVRIVGVGITMGWVCLGSAVLYLSIGRPDLTDEPPQASRIADFVAANVSGLAAPTAPLQNAQPVADVDTMIARLASRLENAPSDVEGWKMLGWSYTKTANFPAAVQAYARAVALRPNDAELLSLYGAAVVVNSDGKVSQHARDAFLKSLDLDPGNARAAYYEGLALDQNGQKRDALTLWMELANQASENAEWRPTMMNRIREISAELNISVEPSQSRTSVPRSGSVGPTAEQVEAANSLSANERQAMILSMVEGLAQRLEQDPNDPEGWARLIRSYTVLGDRPQAESALSKARRTFSENPLTLSQFDNLAMSLGLN